MPELKSLDGKPVLAPPIDEGAVNAAFSASINDDGPDDKAPPKRVTKTVSVTSEPKPRAARTRQPKAEKARTTAAAPVQLSDKQRAEGVQGLAQLGAGIFLMLGKATKKDAYTADAVTIASKAPEIADACVQTAHADARFAAAIDRVCSAGPYAALITVGVGVVSQIARNHGAQVPGTVDPKELLDAQKQAEEQAAVPAAA